MRHNPYFRERCSTALRIAGWASIFVFIFGIIIVVALADAVESAAVESASIWYMNWVQCNTAFLPDALQGLLALLVIPYVATFVLVFVVILSVYRTPEERQHNKDKKKVRAWVSKVKSLSSLANLSVKYFNAYEAERASKHIVENLQSRLQKLENISHDGAEGARVCSQCGAVLPPHSNICEYCGTSFAVKSGDVALPAFANDTKINERIAKTQHELALAEEDYKAKNLEERHLYCDITEKLDLVEAELEVLGCVFVDMGTVDRVLGSEIVRFYNSERERIGKY